MKIAETALPGVLLITPNVFRDSRGSFMETYNQRTMADAGLPTEWPQDNFSCSAKNVVRGIHYQLVHPQGKLVRVAQGAAFDVAVDLRRGSAHFGRHVAVTLDGDTGQMLWIPPGFGHGFVALTDSVALAYKVTDYYYAPGERTVAWNDPGLAIPWPVEPASVILSDKDRRGAAFRDAEVYP